MMICYFEQDAHWSRIRATLEDMDEKFNIEYKPEYKNAKNNTNI